MSNDIKGALIALDNLAALGTSRPTVAIKWINKIRAVLEAVARTGEDDPQPHKHADAYLSELEKIRDIFPMPQDNTALLSMWSSANADPMRIRNYVRATVALLRFLPEHAMPMPNDATAEPMPPMIFCGSSGCCANGKWMMDAATVMTVVRGRNGRLDDAPDMGLPLPLKAHVCAGRTLMKAGWAYHDAHDRWTPPAST